MHIPAKYLCIFFFSLKNNLSQPQSYGENLNISNINHTCISYIAEA